MEKFSCHKGQHVSRRRLASIRAMLPRQTESSLRRVGGTRFNPPGALPLVTVASSRWRVRPLPAAFSLKVLREAEGGFLQSPIAQLLFGQARPKGLDQSISLGSSPIPNSYIFSLCIQRHGYGNPKERISTPCRIRPLLSTWLSSLPLFPPFFLFNRPNWLLERTHLGFPKSQICPRHLPQP